MPGSEAYLLFGQIQQEKAAYYQHHKTELGFQEAVRRLYASGSASCGKPEPPDFLSWNLTDMEQFRNLVYEIPVPIHEVVNLETNIREDVIFLPSHDGVHICMESCFCPNELIAMDCFAVSYVLEGGCLLAENRAVRKMLPGELCILPPNTPHYIRTEPSDIVITILSSEQQFERQFSSLLYQDNIVSDFFRKALFTHTHESLLFMIPPTKDFRSIIQHLFAEYVREDNYSQSVSYSYLHIFYANVIRSVQSTYSYYDRQKGAPVRLKLPAVLDYISQHYQRLTLDDLAEHFNYDGTYLSRQLRISTGYSFSQLITRKKIDQAKNLLASSDLKTGVIAQKTGFNSADHFSLTFKKEMGMSPKEYRNTHRSKT